MINETVPANGEAQSLEYIPMTTADGQRKMDVVVACCPSKKGTCNELTYKVLKPDPKSFSVHTFGTKGNNRLFLCHFANSQECNHIMKDI